MKKAASRSGVPGSPRNQPSFNGSYGGYDVDYYPSYGVPLYYTYPSHHSYPGFYNFTGGW